MKKLHFLLDKRHLSLFITFGIAFGLSVFFFTSRYAAQADEEFNKFTGCLSQNPGVLYDIQLGSEPKSPCPTGDPQVSAISSIKHYQAVATAGMDLGDWTDVPNASISGNFGPGPWKATYTGGMVIQGTNAGTGTGYVRFKVTPQGESPTYVGNITIQRSGGNNGEMSSEQFTLQRLITFPEGQVSIVPQVYGNNSDWDLLNDSVMMLDQ